MLIYFFFVLSSDEEDVQGELFFLYRISHYYYSPLGFTLMMIFGVIISKFTKEDDKIIHPDLISPVSQRFLPKESEKLRYFTVESTLGQIL